ncbi:TPA: hypothetical protein DEP34_04510 [Candidatus Uhrbacteria bacterium]|uniref:Lipoprotein n=2 Tax=Candidatus Uhriibacteriota TaxID=1752732 RepID=A0A0G1SHW6_9BACT|nr:MAG: hypothetical protein UX45_C0007G0023 [Candidatus Uhrbacteria bacterium GW2011_GWF2_46_218]KKU41653.1 MAG: hypothetical protein UX57_C0002G0022 [Candidatus Uhrbacteria bacterium GW2011_GWE2_46_68]HBK33478.1 hypothetical protein [Candidatus Uhrbacteria bacterium]HCB19611.1 hypothetical protein [Candidatus Uhrbacteria bacterium]
MKKIFCLLLTGLVLTGIGCAGGENEPQIGDAPVINEYKKVSITADVILKRENGTEATTCLGSGAFSLDFYFAVGGGNPLVQRGSFQLTDYFCMLIGDMQDCEVYPLDTAYEPTEVSAEADLRVHQSTITSDTGEKLDADRIQFRLETLPAGVPLDIYWYCPGEHSVPKVMPDVALLTQLFLPLYQEGWDFSVAEDYTHTSTRTNYPLNMGVTADITFTLSSTRVSSIEE